MPQRPNFQTIPHNIISRGIDQRSAPNSIAPGYAEDMRNMDTNSTGFVEKRKGYQGYKGNLPLRMESLEVNGLLGSFNFNTDVNLLLTTPSPIVVYGELLQDGTGTITAVDTNLVVGSGTAFTTELLVGSVIIVNGESQVVTSIADDTNLVVGAAFSSAVTGLTFEHRTTAEYYWTTFVNSSRKTVSAGATTTFSLTHGLGTTQIAAGIVNAPTTGSLDNRVIIPDDLIVTSTSEMDITVDNVGGGTDLDFYLLTENVDNTEVVNYRAAISETLTLLPVETLTITIPAATHSLPNLHIIPFLYAEKTVGEFSLIIPDDFKINAVGDVVITLDNANITHTPGTFDGQIVLIDVPGDQALEASFTSGDGKTLVFNSVASDFNFYAAYEQEAGGDQVMVIPDEIEHDETADTVTMTFSIHNSRNMKLVYTEATVKSNVITVDLTDYPDLVTDTAPSISMWGLPHEDILYSNSVTRGGWTNSLEEYSLQGVNKLVAGIGGTLCEEIGTGDGITLPSYFSDMRRRTEANKTIGPFFGTRAGKTRGIDGEFISSNATSIEDITNNGDGTATLDLAMGARFGSLSDLVLDSSLTGYDSITITNAGNDVYNGTHGINGVVDPATYVAATSLGMMSVVYDSDTQATFAFTNNAAAVAFHTTYLTDGDRWSWIDGGDTVFAGTVATGGSALLDPGVGTDVVVTAAALTLSGPSANFADLQDTTFVSEKVTLEAAGTTPTINITVAALTTYTPNESDSGASGTILTDSLVMSATNEEAVNEDLPFLVNDVIVSTLFTTPPSVVGLDPAFGSTRILYMNNLTENILVPAAASINASRTSATQVFTSVANIVKGDTVSALGFDRQFQVTSVNVTASSVTLDESITLSDSPNDRSFLTVTGRWRTIEAPALNDRPLRYFDQRGPNAQERLRGVSINDSIFYSNYDDDVMKYDGTSLYRAGLLNWQPHTHSWVDTEASGIPVTEHEYIKASASDPKSDNNSTIRFSTMPDFDGVSQVILDGKDGSNTVTLTLNITQVNEADKLIEVKETLVDSLVRASLRIPQQIAYYFKLQMIDRNNNLVASAVTDYQETIVNLEDSGVVTHRLTGFPKFDLYDYDRIDILMFRSKQENTANPPFYFVKRTPVDFELLNATGSITITDTASDSILGVIPDDTVSIALKGAELPLSSEQPPRAKYLATSDNRLILGNIKGYNRADVTLISDAGITEDNVLGNATVRITDGVGDKTFEFMTLKETDPDTDDLNLDNNLPVTNVDFATSDSQFGLTLDGSVGSSLTGKFIQLSSHFMDASGTGLYTDSGRTRDNTLGGVIGWWKVLEHTVTTNDTIIIEYTHGETVDWSFGAATNPLYITFPDNGSDNIPVLAIPYSISGNINSIVESVVFDDTTAVLNGTHAVNRGVRDLKMAFNRVMVNEDTPWAYALSGATEGNGRIVFAGALPGKTLTVTVTSSGLSNDDLKIFVNNRKRTTGDSVSGRTTVFPSRLLISAPNFPEMFDNPLGETTIDSDSLLDINANDGQEITGIATFFADSTGASGQLEATVLVFKNKAVYAVNVSTRQLQKLESMGQGCTLPDSISATQSGVMFANRSGVYKVDRRLEITYVGAALERYWEDVAGTTNGEAFGYTDSGNRKYKLSVPVGSSTKNSEMVVLDHIVNEGDGAWTIYDNFGANSWVQTNVNSYFGNYSGRVFALRQLGDATDYRDDAAAVVASFTYGAQSFGDSGSRAVVNRVVSHFRTETDITSINLSVATDMSTTFTTTDSISFVVDNPKVQSIATSIPERHGLYFQVKYEHITKDENMVISGIDFKVQGLGELGVTQATETS